MREKINEELKELFNERFAELWWDLRLPGLGNQTPGEVFKTSPQKVEEYVSNYRESS